MSAVINFYSTFDGLTYECQGDEPIIWIRSERTGNTVSLDLHIAADRAELRAALDAADAIADKGDTK